MSRDYLFPFLFAVLLHGGLALSSYLKPAVHKVTAVPKPETVVVALTLPPEDEPEVSNEPPSEVQQETAVNAPPQLVDVPGVVVDFALTQPVQLQMAPPTLTAKFVIPDGGFRAGTAGKSLEKVFDLASVDQQPEVRSKVNPEYPRDLARTRLSGEVLVGFVVDTKGNVSEPYIVKSTHAGFEAAVLQAVVKWKFKPGRKGGAPVNTRVELPLSFNLEA